MNWFGWLQFALYIFILLVLVKPLGLYMARVYQGERTFLTPVLAPVERFFYRLAGIEPEGAATLAALEELVQRKWVQPDERIILGEYPLTSPMFSAILLVVGDSKYDQKITDAKFYCQGFSETFS